MVVGLIPLAGQKYCTFMKLHTDKNSVKNAHVHVLMLGKGSTYV